MAAYPFQYVNRRGIPVLKTTGVTAETTGVVFSFPNHAFANSWYRGLVLVELAQAIPAGTTGTLPVLFETNGQTKNLTTYNVSIRFTTYFLEVFENIWDKIWRN
ncbi:hypothetical protein [Alistipes putredinis]|uniref:hypothetical protein n=1 Tax=Alistipes putredinis TaxID=28117 RepID=UPI003AB21EAC